MAHRKTMFRDEGVPAADREQFIRDNAVSLVDELQAKVKRQAKHIRKLLASNSDLRRLVRWSPIATAPKDGRRIYCWRDGWETPRILMWKNNNRFPPPGKEYFGDPEESDDYDLIEEGPTRWAPLPATPTLPPVPPHRHYQI